VGIVGKHVYGNLYGLEERKAYTDPDFLKQLVIEAAKRANATVLEAKAWKLEGEKGGVSAIVIVLESHIAVHTWKEYEYATVDVYTCGAIRIHGRHGITSSKCFAQAKWLCTMQTEASFRGCSENLKNIHNHQTYAPR